MNRERVHVEQSGKKLVSGIFGKEANTDAQINALMSDKVRVRNSPRDSTRQDTRLTIPAKTFVASDVAALLRVKDHEIEKLKKEVLDLTEQLRHAHSRIHDLEQMVVDEEVLSEEEQTSAVEKLSTDLTDQHQYPKLRVKSLLDSGNGSPERLMSIQLRCQDTDVESSDASPRSVEHSSVISDETVFQLPHFNVNRLYGSPSRPHERKEEYKVPPRAKIEEIEDQPLVHEEDTVKHPDENSEDYCKEVQCVEMESSSLRYPDLKLSDCCPESYEASIPTPRFRVDSAKQTEVEKTEDRSKELSQSSFSTKEEKEANEALVISSPDKSLLQLLDKDISNLTRNTRHLDLVSPSPEKSSPWLLVKGTLMQKSSRLVRSRSCRESLMSQAAISWFDKDERISSTPSNWSEKESISRSESNQTTPFALKYSGNNYGLSPNGLCQSVPSNWFGKGSTGRPESLQRTPDESRTYASDGFEFGLNMKHVEASKREKTVGFTSVDGANTKAFAKNGQQVVHHQVNETEKKSSLSTKAPRDVALDPMQDYLATLLTWPMEFKRLQKEIIELWQACNVSLSHRTYFFLMHKGDQKDCSYLEVEHRKLLFLRESYSRGSKAVEDGQTQTLASSLRALNRERHKLTEYMQKRLSRAERESMFQRWGIGLKTKNRRLQLANRLWSETKDMENIKESAAVVGKLLGYIDIELASKDTSSSLGLPPKRSGHRRRTSLSLSIL